MLIAASILILLVAGVRVASGFTGGAAFGFLTQFTPVAALAVCSGVYLPKRIAWPLAILPLLLSDLILSFQMGLSPFHPAVWVRYGVLAGLVWAAGQNGRLSAPRWLKVLTGTAAGAFLFYLLSNTVAWTGPEYPHTFQGWLQAQTMGVPGFPPAYWFLLKSLLSEIAFATLFAGAMEYVARAESAHAPKIPNALLSLERNSRK